MRERCNPLLLPLRSDYAGLNFDIFPTFIELTGARASSELDAMQNDPWSPLELYNLKTDPQEQNNLAATNKKVVNELSAALRLHIQRGGATPWQRPAPAAAPVQR